eukprot:scaffold135659_cov37-Tisochrysis_lutea.AAC.1
MSSSGLPKPISLRSDIGVCWKVTVSAGRKGRRVSGVRAERREEEEGRGKAERLGEGLRRRRGREEVWGFERDGVVRAEVEETDGKEAHR